MDSAVGPGKTKVAIARAAGYGSGSVDAAVKEAVSLIGGVEAVVRPGDHVFVKVNHLPPPSPPERGIITHPRFAEAVLKLLLEVTPHVIVGDDLRSDSKGFGVSGYRQVCARLGVRLLNLPELGFQKVRCDGVILKEVFVARALLEADVVVDLPKLKTHSLTLFTGAVKNFYGVIPAGLRVQYHGRYKNIEEFGQVLVDIFSLVRPGLTVMDGIVAMEGNGPANGRLRELGLVIAGRDAVAVDAVATQVIGLDPMAVATTRFAHARGLGVGDLAKIEVCGERLEDVAVGDYALPSTAAARMLDRLPRPLAALITRQLASRPRVVQARCMGCGACVTVCPTGAARLQDGKAWIDRRHCIRCMCCHEACRYDAVVLARPALGAALQAFMDAFRRRPR